MRYPGVRRLPNGRYRIRVSATCPKTGKRKDTVRVIGAKSMVEAVRRREELRLQLAADTDQHHRERLRLDEYATSWMSSRLRELKPSTRRHYASVLDCHILPVLGDYYVDAITPSDVVRWRDAQSGTPATVNSRLTVLRALLRSAHYELNLLRDPYGRTKEVALGPTNRKDFTPEELFAILTWVREREPRWYPLLLALVFTACRFGEVAALTWDDIDWTRNEIEINKSVWQGHVTLPKTGKVRRVPLLPQVAEVLRGLGPGQPQELVFPARGGAHHVPGGFGPILHKASEALGLPKRRGAAHRLRHSANNLLRQVTSGEVTRAITGHANSAMTWHYSHVGGEEKATAMQAVYKLVVGGEKIVGVCGSLDDLPKNVIPLRPRNR